MQYPQNEDFAKLWKICNDTDWKIYGEVWEVPSLVDAEFPIIYQVTWPHSSIRKT